MKLRKQLLQIIIAVIFGNLTMQAQTAEKEAIEDKISIVLSLNHDAFFGFNPTMTGAYSFTETDAFTFYGIQWGAGTGRDWGQWTEFGLGYNKTIGNFNINPQLGFTMGSLLSSGAQGRGIVGDGIVPNLTVNYGSDVLEGQFYYGYYASLSNETTVGQSTNNYVHYWANLGAKFNSFFSVGAHVEQLYLSGGETNGGGSLDRADGYLWLGPYLQFKKGATGLRFSFGANLEDKATRFAANDFYKLTFFVSL
jgi:hypothetical protein